MRMNSRNGFSQRLSGSAWCYFLNTYVCLYPSCVQESYVDTVRRMAVVQIKHARLARELQAGSASERMLQERVGELEEEVRRVG